MDDVLTPRPSASGSIASVVILVAGLGFAASLPVIGKYIAKHDPYAPMPTVQYEQNRAIERPTPANMNDSLKVMKKYI